MTMVVLHSNGVLDCEVDKVITSFCKDVDNK